MAELFRMSPLFAKGVHRAGVFHAFRPTGFALVTAATLLACAGVAAAQQQLPQTNPASQAASQPRAQQPSMVTYKDGLLSVSARAAALTEVLDQISAQAQIVFVEAEELSSQRISVAFENLPLAEGLQRLFKDYDSFLFFGVDDKPPASVRAVWLYPRGRGRGVTPVPRSAWASTAELNELVKTLTDPKERAEVFGALIARGGPRARDAVIEALGDADDQVRSFALYTATSNQAEVAPELLMQSLNDPSRDVRFLALHALAARSEAAARAAAEFIRTDQDPVLRREAEQILEQLAGTSKPQPAPPPNVRKRQGGL